MNVIFSLWSRYESSQLSPGDQSAGTRETEEIQAGGQRPAGRKGLCLARAQFPEPLSHTQRRTMDAYPSALLRGTYRGPCNKRDGEKTASCTGDPRGIGAFPKSSRGKETGDRMAEKLTRNQRDGRAGLHRHQGAVVCPRPGPPPPGGWGREPRVTPPGSAELCLQDSAARREAWKPAFRFARPHGF